MRNVDDKLEREGREKIAQKRIETKREKKMKGMDEKENGKDM